MNKKTFAKGTGNTAANGRQGIKELRLRLERKRKIEQCI
jgi:hypothetical protein